MALNIVLIEPEIPTNTGNIGRLSLAAGAHLHLVKPFGFELDDTRVKRAGLDYWKHVQLHIYDSQDEFFQKHAGKPMAFLTRHAEQSYLKIPFEDETFLIFGKESVGLPKPLTEQNAIACFGIPVNSPHVRSLNLANAVSLVVYEGLRVLGSPSANR